MAPTFTQEQVNAIVDRAVQAVRRENETLRAQLQAVLTDNALRENALRAELQAVRAELQLLKARVRLEVAWRAAILAGRAQTPSNHGGLLTGRCLP